MNKMLASHDATADNKATLHRPQHKNNEKKA